MKKALAFGIATTVVIAEVAAIFGLVNTAQMEHRHQVADEMAEHTPLYRTEDAGGVVGAVGRLSPSESEQAQLAMIQDALITGHQNRAKQEISRYNDAGYAGGSLFFFDDPKLAEKGVKVHPTYARHSRDFAVKMRVKNSGSDQIRVIVPPGATVRAEGKYQDVATLSYRVFQARPYRTTTDRVSIACAEFGDDDPRSGNPVGLSRHQQPDVAKVTSAANRLGVTWETAQVALWAVTNDVELGPLLRAPGGSYRIHNVHAAKDVVAAAGLNPQDFNLWKSDSADSLEQGLSPIRQVFGG